MDKFYLGIDIGTESVGMACTDERYNLLRAKGKDLWSVRLFDKANDSKSRRQKGTARRRLLRRKQRIDFLQEIFAPHLNDDLFFIRLNNSGFYEEDKNEKLKTRFSLFADEDYNDRTFYENYPTIFHLRNALIKGKKEDLRHYYLALHHIIKYRGHFLFEGESSDLISNISTLFDEYNICVDNLESGKNLFLDREKAKKFLENAKESKGLNDKKKFAYELFETQNASTKEVLGLLLGAKVNAVTIFGDEYSEKYKNEKISFKELTDEKFEELQFVFEEEHFSVLERARAIYNYIVFAKVLNGKSYISEAMVELYDKHAADLYLLKKFVKANYDKTVYNDIFRSLNEKANYVNYIGWSQTNGKVQKVKKINSVDEFYKFLKKTLTKKPVADVDTLNYILNEIDNGSFLPKIIDADNGVFPHQINGIELDAILKNLCENYPQFAQKGADGYSPAEKIKMIFLFKIPYYVGPLNTFCEEGKERNAWMVRKAEGKITPWNFEEKVNLEASNEKFIRKMTNKCTYLHGQDVLPKSSMYYQAFDTLNQINKLTIGGVPISVELKQEIFHNLYLCYKKVTVKNIENYLLSSGKCTVAELKNHPLGGFDVETGLKASMNSYVIFKSKFGDLVDEKPEIFERIILWHTLNTDKNLVEKAVLANYGQIEIIKENIKWIKGLTSFKDFGRLSKKLICELSGGIDYATGEIYTVINRLYYTNMNFNQILNYNDYSFVKAIDIENSGEEQNVDYDAVKDLYVSPLVRRGIWQALQMTDEFVHTVGQAPDKIFIEVTRHDETKERTVSRKNKIFELYNNFGADCADMESLLNELNGVTDSDLRKERLYLYFLQFGRCVYSGERIVLNQLSTNLYDVDHIMPRSIIKDDSIDNKVLVKREKNEEKKDRYPLPDGFTNQQRFWNVLHNKNGAMSDKKYSLLTRTKPLSDADFNVFLNRQLVVTNQTIKAVAELLKRKFSTEKTKIVYSKAGNVNDFKKKYGIVKCRETNDLHHARDAYLNIVVGNVYDTKFTSAYDYYYRKPNDFWREYNLEKMFDYPVKDVWTGSEDVARIKNIVKRTSMQVTRYSYVKKGSFFDETVLRKGDKGIAVPRKDCYPYNQTDKYGGYTTLNSAYFAIVSSKDKKGNVIKTIEAIPVLIDYKSRTDADAVYKYLLQKGLKEPEVIIPKLKMKTLVSVNGYKVWLAGITGSQILLHNAQQWFTDEKTDFYVKKIFELVENANNGKYVYLEDADGRIPLKGNRKGVTDYITKEKNLELYKKIIETLNLKKFQGLSSVTSFAEKLLDKQSTFEGLTAFNQIKVLCNIVRFMKCNPECANLELLNEGKGCGKILISKNITDVDFKIIHQSPCGLIERIQKV